MFGLVIGTMLKIWKPIVFIVGFALIIALIASWIGLIIGFIAGMPFATFLFGTPMFAFLGVANIFFIVALPIIGFIQFAARYVFKREASSNLRSGMFVFWIVNIVSFFGIGSFVARDFNQEKETVQAPQEHFFAIDSIQLTMGEERGKNSLIEFDRATIVDDNLVLQSVDIDFEKSEDNKFRIFKSYFSRGKNSQEIEELTNEISYDPIINGNEIIFPADFMIPKGSKWRKQKVKIRVAVPEGKTIKFGNEDYNHFNQYVDHHHSSGGHNIPLVRWHGEHIWTMQEKGWYSKPDATQEKGTDLGFKDFKSVRVKGDIKVEIKKGDFFEVKVTGKERGLRTVDLEQIGDVIHIETGPNHRSYPVRLYVTAPDLESVDVEETDDVKISGFDGKKLAVSGERSEEVKVFVSVDSLSVNFKRTKSDIRGKGKFLKAKLDNASMDAEHFVADNAYITAEDTRKIKVEVVDTLHKDLSRGSRISFEEDPKIIIDERQLRREREEESRKREQANRQ